MRRPAPPGERMMDLPLATVAPILGLLALLLGALAGTAGYAATVGRRQAHLMADLAARLALHGPLDRAEIAKIEDARLRDGFERLAQRVGEAWTLATTDLLTGIANRQVLLTTLEREIERASRYGRQLAIAIIDIDHFKRLNDTFGHAAGDVVLHRVAQALHEAVRSVDVVGRYGGEEFMVILPETDVDAGASIAEKLRRLVGRLDVEIEAGAALHVTISAGVAGGLGQHLLLDELIRDADAALYSAKALGRNQVQVFHEVEDDGIIPRASIAPAAREQAVEVGRAAMGAATRSLTDALDARPGWAGRPSLMIAETAIAVARAIGLPDGEIERIRTASLLHDLGKLAIPDEILDKPSELDGPEWRVVAEHPKIGQVVLEQAGALRDAATIVLHHHEWFDGRGYPHGLRGQDIPIGARIVAVADAYEAMVSGRPYRHAVSHAAALAELRRHAGAQFDPEVVSLFVAMFEGGVPWLATGAGHGHSHPHPHPHAHPPLHHPGPTRNRGDGGLDQGEIHDALHARRRLVGAGVARDGDGDPACRAGESAGRTGTDG
ncbi:MAG TPA: diguanylate cyclase [Candidatus Limnocylindrales bacterium]